MQWHVGGNFEPVSVTCAQDWLKCPSALAYYIWFEAVADVADCLANESILWRILAILLICTTIIHLIYWKIRWTREICKSKENVKKVDFKIQDLELKVNILTYKLQYGTWPLPHTKGTKCKGKSQELKIALSKFNQDNNWIKHLLTSVRRKNLKRRELICDIRSQSSISDSNNLDVETKYLSPKFGDTSLKRSGSVGRHLSRISITEMKNDPFSIDRSVAECHLAKQDRVLKDDASFLDLPKRLKNQDDPKLFKTLSDNSIPCHYLENSIAQAQQCMKKDSNIEKRHPEDDKDCSEGELGELPSSTDITLISNDSPKHQQEMEISCTDPHENNRGTQETLHQVKKRLKSLHLTLQSYNSKNCAKVSDNINRNSSYFEGQVISSHDSNFDSNETWENDSHKYISDDSTMSQNNEDALNFSRIVTTYSTFGTVIVNGQRPLELFEYVTNDEESTTENMADSSQDEVVEVKELEKSKFLTLSEELKSYKIDVNKSPTEIKANNCSTGDTVIDAQDQSKDCKYKNDEKTAPQKFGPVNNEGSDIDDKSTVLFLHEAFDTKNELSRQILSRNIDSEITVEEMMGKGDFSDYSSWNNVESTYQPQMLDMITEESSGTSSSNAQSRTNINVVRSKSDTHLDGRIMRERRAMSVVKHESTQTFESLGTDDKSEDSESQKQENLNLFRDLNSQESSVVKTVDRIMDAPFENERDDTGSSSVGARTDLNLNLKESSSDTSVNRLIDRLIESERKCKSARSSSNAKTEAELAIDSLNSFMESQAFFTDAHSENECCDSSSAEIDMNHATNLEEMKTVVDNLEPNPIDRLDSELLQNQDIQSSTSRHPEEMVIDGKHSEKLELITDESKTHDQEPSENSVTITDLMRKENSTPEMKEKNSELHLEQIDYEQNTKCYEIERDDSFSMSGIKTAQGIDESKLRNRCENEESVGDNYQPAMIENELKQDVSLASEIVLKHDEEEKKDAGDFLKVNNLPMQELAPDQELNLLHPDTEKTVDMNSLPSGDTVLNSQRTMKDNQYHVSCKTASGVHFASVLKNQEQAGKKITKLTSSSSIPKQSIKSNSDTGSSKQLKTRSNSNLISADKTSPVPVHRRSKSYAVYRDLSPNVRAITVEKKNSSESLMLSNRSSQKSCSVKESAFDNKNSSMSKRENSSESLALSCRSLQSSQTADTPREVSFDQEGMEFKIDRSSSFKSLSISSESSQSHIAPSSRKSCIGTRNENKIVEQRQSTESLLSKVSGRSSIPVLKSRLENDKRSNSECQSMEQLQGPPTALLGEDYETKSYDEYELKVEKSPKSHEEREIVLLNPENTDEIHNTGDSQQNAVIYVTTRVLDPKQFLEYVRDKDLKILDVRNQSYDVDSNLETNEAPVSPTRDARVFHSLSDICDCADMSSFNSSLLQLQDNLSNSLFLKVDSRETEVLVKPSTVDTSTSISNLSNAPKTVKKTTEFKIFEVPEELTKEEYISLLQIINENPDLEQLSHMDNLCNKLGLEFRK